MYCAGDQTAREALVAGGGRAAEYEAVKRAAASETAVAKLSLCVTAGAGSAPSPGRIEQCRYG